jgi:probable phosphoglycerate mutase
MTTLLLIRHGQSEANLSRVFAGNYNAPLTDLGLRQAEKTAEFIAENYKVDCVYSSDLIRAFETGKTVANALNLTTKPNDGLREIRAGEWEALPFDDIVLKFPEEYKIWKEDIGNSSCPNGESVKVLGERVMSTLTAIAEENDGKTVVIATHATPIRVSRTLIEYGNLAPMQDIPWVSNASVTELIYDNGKWTVGRVGQDSHLSEFRTNLPNNV